MEDAKIQNLMGSSKNNVVIPIHGTWGRGIFPSFRVKEAKWCQENSTLACVYRQALGDGTTSFSAFSWSSANCPDHRLIAAKALADHARNILKTLGPTQIHFVAHSHAGNIIAYALASGLLQGLPIGSIIFLATPFLFVGERFDRERDRQYFRICAAAMAFVISFAVALAIDLIIERFLSLSPLHWIQWVVTVPLPVGIGIYTYRGAMAWQKECTRYVSHFHLPTRESVNCPVLILRSAGDEAAAALSAPVLLSRASSLLTRALVWLIPSLESPESGERIKLRHLPIVVHPYLAGSLGFVILGSLAIYGYSRAIHIHDSAIVHRLYEAAFALESILFGALLFLGIGSLAVLVLLSPAVLLMCGLHAVMLLPFGPRFAWFAPGLEVSAEASLPGEWAVEQLDGAGAAFRHSIHSDPRALEKIRSWLTAL